MPVASDDGVYWYDTGGVEVAHVHHLGQPKLLYKTNPEADPRSQMVPPSITKVAWTPPFADGQFESLVIQGAWPGGAPTKCWPGMDLGVSFCRIVSALKHKYHQHQIFFRRKTLSKSSSLQEWLKTVSTAQALVPPHKAAWRWDPKTLLQLKIRKS